MLESVPWSPWATLDDFPRLSADTLRELLDGGQAFRWNVAPDGSWRGIWSDVSVALRLSATGRLEWRTPLSDVGAVEVRLREYLGRTTDYDLLLDALPWRSDSHLATCLREFPGLRILRQPFGETLLCFLCSATKQIVQIKQIVALLADRFGAPLPGGAHALPTWRGLAAVSEADLRRCLLGFRARYIHQTAQFLATRPGWLEKTADLPYPEAKDALCSLPGVGEKVADCVLLFGAGRMEAFPVDVWILKTMERRYGLKGWRPAQIAQFGRVHFGTGAGLAQQFLFAYERKTAGRGAKRGTTNEH